MPATEISHGWRHQRGGADEIPGLITLVPLTGSPTRDPFTPIDGDLLVGTGSPPGFGLLTVGTSTQILGVSAGFPAWISQTLLHATHTDTTPASVVRGDVITGQGASPTWSRLAISVPAVNVRNVFGVDNGDTEPAWKTALDSTNPADIATAASPGTSLIFAHRDHVHNHPNLASDLHNVYFLLAGRSGGQYGYGGTGAGDDLIWDSTSHPTKGLIQFESVAHFHGALDETAESHDRVSIGISSGTPRVLFEDGASATIWEIDNNAGTLRLFNPGTVRAQLSTTTLTVGPSSTIDGLISGYLRVGSASAPSNTTAGDITGIRLHIGTDAAFTSGYGVEVNAAKVIQTGSFTNNSANETAFLQQVTFAGSGSAPFGMQIQPTFDPSGSIAAAYGMFFQTVASPASTRTITDLQGLYAQMIYQNVAGAVTTGRTLQIAAPSIVGSLKPTTQYGVYISNQGATGIFNAIGLYIAKPTNATGNYYMEFDTGDATDPTGGGGAAAGRIPVIVGGAAKYLAYF